MPVQLRFVSSGRFPHYTMLLKRIHGHHAIHLFDGGGMQLEIEKRQFLLTEGMYYWYLPPGIPSLYHPAPGYEWWSHRYITFQGDLADEWFAAGLFPSEPQRMPPEAESQARFDAIIDLAAGGAYWATWQARAALETLLVDWAVLRGEAPRVTAGFEAIVDDIERNIGQKIDYEALAQRHGMAYRTLRREFRARMGMSLHQYHLHRKMAIACELLKTTDLPLKALADRLGYADVSNFTTCFRKHLFMTPGQYRCQPIEYAQYP
jgi:AraC-like DNA-binding protein